MVSPTVKDLDPYVRKQNAKLVQVVQNFFTKSAQIIVGARSEEGDQKEETRINKWFNLLMPSVDREELKHWKSTVFPPMIIETSVDLRQLSENHTLVLKDENGHPWTAIKGGGKKQEVVIERWLIEFDLNEVSGSIVDELPLIYKQAIILFRGLFAFLRLMPAFKLRQQLKKSNQLSLTNRILDGKQPISSKGRIGLSKTIIPHQMLTTDSHLVHKNFHPIHTTLGTLKVSSIYRNHYDFAVHDSEEALSNHFMNIDSSHLKYSVPRDEQQQEAREAPQIQDVTHAQDDHQDIHQGPDKPMESSVTGAEIDLYRKSMSISPNTVRDSSPAKRGTPPITGRPAIQPFRVGSISSSPPPQAQANAFGASSLERKISITSNKSTSNASLAALLRNPKGSNSSTTGNIPISNTNNNVSSMPKSVSSSHGSNLAHEIDSSFGTTGEVTSGTPRFSSSFGSRASRRFSNTNVRQSILQQTLNDHSYLGTSAGSTTSINPLSGIYIDDDIGDFVRMIDSKSDLRFSGNSNVGGSSERVNVASNSQLDALNKFQLLRSQHQQLGDSVNQSLILQSNNSSNPASLNNPVLINTSRKSSTHSQSIYSPISPSPLDNRNPPSIDGKLDEKQAKQVEFNDVSSRRSSSVAPPSRRSQRSTSVERRSSNYSQTQEEKKVVKGLSTTPSVYSNRRSIQYENVFEDDDGEDFYLQHKNQKPPDPDQSDQPEEEDDDLLFTMSDMNLTKN